MNATVTSALITPAAISVASTSKAAAAGPTTAKLSGTPAIEMSSPGSTTRPSRWPGTSRCSSVNQITTSAVMRLSETNATAIACHTVETSPNPAVINIPTAHVT